jgi:endoglucanase Acf2
MKSITPAEAAQMTASISNFNSDVSSDTESDIASDKTRCVVYTSAELQTIINMAGGSNVQFQFAKNVDGPETGKSTLVVALPIASGGHPNSFFKPEDNRICPPPDTCMLT